MSEVLGGWLMGSLPPGCYRISIEWTKVPSQTGPSLTWWSQVLASWGFFLTTLSNTHSFFYSFTYFFP